MIINGFFIKAKATTPEAAPKLAAIKVGILTPEGAVIMGGATALIDTGANGSAIDAGLMSDAGILPVGSSSINRTGELGTVSIYKVVFEIEGGLHFNTYAAEAKFAATQCNYLALLGMDFIQHFGLTVDHISGVVKLNRG